MKLLLKYMEKNATFKTKANTGSTYWFLGGAQIRISDHFAANKESDYCICFDEKVPNTFIVYHGRDFKIIRSFAKLKGYLDAIAKLGELGFQNKSVILERGVESIDGIIIPNEEKLKESFVSIAKKRTEQGHLIAQLKTDIGKIDFSKSDAELQVLKLIKKL